MKTLKTNQSFLVLIFIAIAFGFIQNQLCKKTYDFEEMQMVPAPLKFFGTNVNPRFVKGFLGTRNLVADLIWVDVLAKHFNAEKNVSYSTFYQATKNMQELDPYMFKESQDIGIYMACVIKDIAGASEIMENAAKKLKEYLLIDPEFPKKFRAIWSLFMYTAYHFIIEVADLEKGHYWIQEAAKVEGAPDVIKDYDALLSTKVGRIQIASSVLNDIYRRAKSEEDKAVIKQRLVDIEKSQELVEINENFQKFLNSTGAHVLEKKKAFELFLRSYHMEKKDAFGRRLFVDDEGKIKASE